MKRIKNLFGLMIASIMLMLSFLSPIVAHADQGYTRMDNDITFNFTIKNFHFYGEPVKPDYQWTEGRIIVNNNWAFCVDPGHRFVEGWKDLTNFEQYPNVDNQLVKKMAIGTDWIFRQPELTINQKYALSQYYIWRALKGTYYTYTDMWITGMTEINQSDYINRADNFALSNLDNYEATGNIYRSPTGLFDSQPVVQFSLRYIGKGNAKLIKTTAENTHLTGLCPEHYSLEGAVYGIYSDAGATAEVGTLTTNANGESNEVALAPATYFVKEKVAPKGYKLDNDIYPVTITTGTTATVNVSDKPLFDPFSFKIYKQKEDGVQLSVEGAEYTIKYYKELVDSVEELEGKTPFRTWTFRTDKNGEIRARDKWKVGGDELFKEADGTTVGLIGSYTVEETLAPKGFAKTEGIISLQKITTHNQTNDVDVFKDVIDVEKTQKINIEINKKDSETNVNNPQGFGSLKGAIYEVIKFNPLGEDEKVGEIVTDENGVGRLEGLEVGVYHVIEKVASTGYNLDKVRHIVEGKATEINTAFFEYKVDSLEKPITVELRKTTENNREVIGLAGAKLQLLDSEGNIIENFTTTEEAKVLKGLPKGRYTVKEIEAPQGYFPLEEDYTFEVEEKEEVQHFDIFNEKIPTIHTTALFDTGIQEGLPKENLKVIDKVEYKDLLVGREYTVTGKIVSYDDETRVVAEGTTTFTPATPNGYVDVEFTVDTRDFEGKKLVVFENLYRDGKLKASHEDKEDEKQTLHISKIRTTATDKKDGGKDLLAGKKQTIVDEVKYTNLIVGKEYTIKGTLMNKTTGEKILIDGKEITAEKTFTAEKPNGIQTLEFTFDSKAVEGETIVVFEDVYRNGILVGLHADLTDEAQTIYIPKVRTTASDKKDSDKLLSSKGPHTIVDEVRYTNLIIGKEYTVKGKLMDKETGKVVIEDGKEVTAEKTFIAEEKDGKIELEFTVKTDTLVGKDIVVFENMYREGKLVGSHEDLTDKDQTVKVVKIGEIKVSDKHKLGKSAQTGDASDLTTYILILISSIAALFTTKTYLSEKK